MANDLEAMGLESPTELIARLIIMMQHDCDFLEKASTSDKLAYYLFLSDLEAMHKRLKGILSGKERR